MASAADVYAVLTRTAESVQDEAKAKPGAGTGTDTADAADVPRKAPKSWVEYEGVLDAVAAAPACLQPYLRSLDNLFPCYGATSTTMSIAALVTDDAVAKAWGCKETVEWMWEKVLLDDDNDFIAEEMDVEGTSWYRCFKGGSKSMRMADYRHIAEYTIESVLLVVT